MQGYIFFTISNFIPPGPLQFLPQGKKPPLKNFAATHKMTSLANCTCFNITMVYSHLVVFSLLKNLYANEETCFPYFLLISSNMLTSG